MSSVLLLANIQSRWAVENVNELMASWMARHFRSQCRAAASAARPRRHQPAVVVFAVEVFQDQT